MSVFIESIKRPLSCCCKQSLNTFLWSIFTIIGGLLGVFINIIQRCIFENMTICQSIYIDSVAGSFYMYALVLISATLGPLFMGLVDTTPPHFRKQKMCFVAISIFVMIFNAVFYSAQVRDVGIAGISNISLCIDFWQVVFFLISIFLAIYSLGIQYIDKKPEEHEVLESYSEKESANVEKLKEETANTSIDGLPL